jgi:hypothetical protein
VHRQTIEQNSVHVLALYHHRYAKQVGVQALLVIKCHLTREVDEQEHQPAMSATMNGNGPLRASAMQSPRVTPI